MSFAERYLQKHAEGPALIGNPPLAGLKNIITIPAYKESGLNQCLDSLFNMVPLPDPSEIIVLFNAPEDAPDEILKMHDQAIAQAAPYKSLLASKNLTLHLVSVDNLPKKHFGAGLARKLVMDEAVRRFNSIGRSDGLLLSLDADTVVAPGYLQVLSNFFAGQPDMEGCSIHFEHPLDNNAIPRKGDTNRQEAGGMVHENDLTDRKDQPLTSQKEKPAPARKEQPEATENDRYAAMPDDRSAAMQKDQQAADRGQPYPEKIYHAITNYEVHLRYYLMATRYTGFPYACHTVGSAFAVSAAAYTRYGGMNRRQAGEDFYFIQKVAMNGRWAECNDTAVYPSPRPSDRVLFGTGADITKQLKSPPERYLTFHPELFTMLREFFSRGITLYGATGKTGEQQEAGSAGSTLNEVGSAAISSFEKELHPVMANFLKQTNYKATLNEIFNNVASEQAFRQRFFRNFNWLWLLRFLHYGEQNGFGKVPLEEALPQLFEKLNIKLPPEVESPKKILVHLRRLQINTAH